MQTRSYIGGDMKVRFLATHRANTDPKILGTGGHGGQGREELTAGNCAESARPEQERLLAPPHCFDADIGQTRVSWNGGQGAPATVRTQEHTAEADITSLANPANANRPPCRGPVSTPILPWMPGTAGVRASLPHHSHKPQAFHRDRRGRDANFCVLVPHFSTLGVVSHRPNPQACIEPWRIRLDHRCGNSFMSLPLCPSAMSQFRVPDLFATHLSGFLGRGNDLAIRDMADAYVIVRMHTTPRVDANNRR
ncbi:hypothetical protein GGTG_03600 [Gaeumannomyces tritici R3-111a-1]|uniref:Uncharacterized protein n=1 Tax=Gaeumannomyces tritici (strain R3-111a-1) TaxID=644352 RepID=J3NQP4_GAET3|nr:hypothetical protein GGTG_03600 [Gaeumannomyces tritici R3-111a-1]EJT78500.1 hypothetical protein GGTG_03600 [Gaeumannomyces tritici R3-111a-1]